MKQLMYFCFGVLLSVLLLIPNFAHATETFDIACLESKIAAQYPGVYQVISITNNIDTSYYDILAYGSVSAKTLLLNTGSDCFSDNKGVGPAAAVNINGFSTAHPGPQTYYLSLYIQGYDPGETITDSDGDGILDEFDLYPNDSTDYQFSVISAVLDAQGNPVQIIVKTDRDDLFAFGDRPIDMTGYTDEIYIAPYLRPGGDLEYLDFFNDNSDTAIQVDNSAYYDQIENMVIAETDPGTGTDFSDDSTPATGSETDNEALQKIVTNTDATSDNITRLGDYLDSINDTLGRLESKYDVALSATGSLIDGGGTSSEDIQGAITSAMDVAQGDIDSSVAAAGNVDTEYNNAFATITDSYDLAVDAPEDFQEKTDIITKMTDYVSNNPISAIINGSSINLTGSVDHLTWTYNGQNIELSVGKYDNELTLFGQLLMGVTTLAGMLMIFRG